MSSFNVMDRTLDLQKSYLLEASAGTGKTYSIENIVVRLLIDKEKPLLLENILVVTFTRAATAELRQRVRQTIGKAIGFLAEDLPNTPDYLLALIEQGEKPRQQAKKALEQALFCFDQAQIFTIHGFCSRMLRDNGFECDLGFSSHDDTGNVSFNQLLGVVRNYLRTETSSEVFSPEQLRIILKDDLEKKLCKLLNSGVEVQTTPNFSEQLTSFQTAMEQLKKGGYTSSTYIYEDFLKQSLAYNKIYSKKVIKPEIQNRIEKFVDLFEKSIWNSDDFDLLIRDGICLLELLDPKERSVKGKLPSDDQLHYPRFCDDLRRILLPTIELAKSPMANYARLAAGCQTLFQRYCAEEELASPDDLLKMMYKGVHNEAFASRIRQQYRAVIIDEFQDTDPVQWGIFNTLFVPTNTLYLVGDPKQSIYAFRRADIYTYLEAAKAVESHLTLDTNYRSQKSLVEALNKLFSHTSALIPLPRLKTALPYNEVKASTRTPEKSFSDELGAVHFFIGRGKAKDKLLEEELYFPFMAQEIKRITAKDGIALRQIAILVKNRFEGKKILEYLSQVGIPALSQKSESLADSPALPLMQALLQAALHPSDQSAVKIALGGRLIGWTHDQLHPANSSQIDEAMARFRLMRLKLHKGFIPFFQDFMESCWGLNERTVAEKLLAEKGGLEIYQDLLQIGELLAEQQSQAQASPEALLPFLETFPLLKDDEDIQMKKRQDPTQDAAQIMTLHMSKGLEFDLVFAFGLVNRYSPKEELIRVPQGENTVLASVWDKESPAYKLYQEENDAEKMRQLYVAMTRAKHRLYLPVLIDESPQEIKQGSASCMDLFLTGLVQGNTAALIALIDKMKQENVSITYSELQKTPLKDELAAALEPVSLNRPLSCPQIPGAPTLIYSFTSLMRGESEESIHKETPPHDLQAQNKSIHTLPAGADTGNLLHQIFETISFEQFNEMKQVEDCLPLIHPFLQQHPLQEWSREIAEIIFHVLKMRLGQESFSLSEIAMNQIYREMEFLYPWEGAPVQLPEEVHLENQFLKGFIDLLFLHQGKYYIVDWKSNWLGSSSADYHEKNLEQAMDANGYHFQAKIYQEALRRYLKLIDQRSFKECFGGIYYLFLRGGAQGVYQII